jgi:S-DNA-T family DNA segregation ATPase FtsK/SpoIIIE
VAKSANGSSADVKLDPVFARALRQALFFLLAAFALVLLIALSSYDRSDPSYSFTGEPGAVGNLIGTLGAHVADLLLLAFGWPAYLFPFVIAFSAWVGLMRTPGEPGHGRSTIALRTIGLVIVLATSCGLAALHYDVASLPAGAGGILGNLVGNGLESVLALLGATLVMLALWFAGVQLYTGVSWPRVMDYIGHWVLAGASWVRSRMASSRDQAVGRESRAARETAVREVQKKAATRTPPRIETAAPSVPEASVRVEKERQVQLFAKPAARDLPELKLLDDPPAREKTYSPEALDAISRLVEIKLKDFGIEVEVVAVLPGPVITRFELKPAPGVKVSQISALAKDLARALSAISVRVVEVIPGKSVVGLEIPNESRELVTLGEIVRSRAYDELASPLALALGKDIGGAPVVTDLAKMPHLLIAGTTGSGKSVAINAMVLSLLYKSTAEHVRLIMIDPKMLELSVYEGIPHLLAPVVTDMKQATNALRWCVAEMERRYHLMKELGVRNLGGFNRKVRDAQQANTPIPDPLIAKLLAMGKYAGEVPALQPLPYIVVVMATQRPSVDVITGLIKANIPSRIAFQVSAKVDSRTILDQNGAESLLSHGDMLYLPSGSSTPERVHGAFVSDQEVHRVVASLQGGVAPLYVDEVLTGPQEPIPGLPGEAGEGGDTEADGEQDPLYDEAVRIVTESRRASVSGVQRRLKIGYNRAARLVESMEAAGLVGPLQSNGSREVLAPPPPES